MRIGDLDEHCGECDVMEFCGEAFGYCLCYDARFSDIDEEEYKRIAERTPAIKSYDDCIGCTRMDCDIYRYSETERADTPCEHRDLSRDYYCEQVAEYVHSVLKSSSSCGDTKGGDAT